MPNFQFTVDTQPMAREIARVAERVDKTSVAVVSMKLAVVAAQSEATDNVCRNVNVGFFSLIRSQITQKIARLQSDVDSNLMQMVQQKKALYAIQQRMERDYFMIASRYQKLFHGLNANLRSRVFTLDRPTVEFATKDLETLYNRARNLTATVPVTQLESVTISQRMLASHAKSRCREVIESMQRFLGHLFAQNALTDRILLTDPFDAQVSGYAIPVVVHEQTTQLGGGTTVRVTAPATPVTDPSSARIMSEVLGRYGELRWTRPATLDLGIVQEFERNVRSSTRSDRVKNMTLQLFRASPPEVIAQRDS